MNITVQVEGIKELMEKFKPQKIARGIQAALNKTAKSSKTETSKQLRERWNLKKIDIDRKIIFKGAYGANLQASITVTGEPISLMYFGPKATQGGITTYAARNKKGTMPGLAQKRGGRNTGGRVQVTALTGRQTTLRKAFFTIATKGGTPLVVWRSKEKIQAGKYKKGKLKAYKIITLPSMFSQSKVMASVEAKIKTQWQKEWDNQIKQLQSGQGWMEK